MRSYPRCWKDSGTLPAGPSYRSSSAPLMISATPSVAMKACTRSLVTIRPFTRPTVALTASTAATAAGTPPSAPAMISAATSEVRLIR